MLTQTALWYNRPIVRWEAIRRRDERLIVLAILGLALALRLWQLDLVQFDDDQATLLAGARQFLTSHQIPLTSGMASTIGVRVPPLVTFLLAIPLLLSASPVLATAWVALLDGLAVVPVYLVGRRLASPFAGLAAALLYAVSPAAIVFGRRIWDPDFVPFFAALALWGLVEFWTKRRAWALAVSFVAIACAAQLYLLAIVELPLWLVVAGLRVRDLRWPALAAGLGVAGFIASPYLWLEVTSGWSDARNALAFLGQPKHVDAAVADVLARLLGGSVYSEELLPWGQAQAPFALNPAGWLVVALVAAGLVLAVVRRPAGWPLVATWMALPALSAIRHTSGVDAHNFLVLLPAGPILAGLALAAAGPRLLSAGVLAAVVASQLAGYASYIGQVPSAVGDNYGMPLRYVLAAADVARRETAGAVYVADPDTHAGVFPYVLGPVKRFDGRFTFVFPQSQALYVIENDGGFAYQFASSHYPSVATIATPQGTPAYGLFRLSATDTSAFEAEPLTADLGASVELKGYLATGLAAGQASPVTIEWQIRDPTAAGASDVRQFAHLVDSQGKTWSTNADFRGFPRSLWGPGDTVLSRFDLDLPADTPRGGYWLETGFYTPPTNARLAPPARVGPLKVDGQSDAMSGSSQPLATFGQAQLALIDAQVQGEQVSLLWRALGKPPADYTVFVHLLDATGRVVAQHDGPPVNSSYPTSLWAAGETVRDDHALVGEAGSGVRLEVGLYTQPGLQRLPASGGDGASMGDHYSQPLR
jgi:hypothetical protein